MPDNSRDKAKLLYDSFKCVYEKDISKRESCLEEEGNKYISSDSNFSLEKYRELYKQYERKANLRKSFDKISKTPDRLNQELDFSREAKNFAISLEEYRRLYELRREVTFIQEYPLGWNPIEWIKYIRNLKPVQIKSLAQKAFTIPSLLKTGAMVTAIVSMGGVALYWYEMPQRAKQAQYQAWEIINGAKGQTGEGGRINALQDLLAYKVPLESVDISNAFLSGINLPKSNLSKANLSKANLSEANLSGANLNKTNLGKANLRKANFREVNLLYAKLNDADLKNADLTNTDLGETDFTGADLRDTDLMGASFGKTILSCSKESCTNLQGAKNIDLEEIKQAYDWDKACYDPNIAIQLGQKPELQNQKCSKIDRS
jgi:hypothetical protein